MPSPQTTMRPKPAKASGAGIWQRITASDTAFLPLVDPSDLLDLLDLLRLSSRWVRQRLGLKGPGRVAPKAKPTACPKWAELNGARLARQPSFAGKINKRDFALTASVGAEVLLANHPRGNRLRDKDPGKTKTFERDPSQSNRIARAHGARLAKGPRRTFPARRIGHERADYFR